MLSARSQGIGTCLTTVLGTFKHQEVADLLGVPVEKGWINAAAVTCGYPLGKWGWPNEPQRTLSPIQKPGASPQRGPSTNHCGNPMTDDR